ncbi:MAG: DUF1552 domain-containing protein [Gemmatimonadetes bacterium]|nr:DUF1552 domain-containing protein [Gemmatimonadota bacterium]
MNFITGKHLSRRTMLRGTGALVALPFMDAMVPAGRLWRDPAAGFTRFIGIEESMGCAGGSDWGDQQNLFAPAKMGRGLELGIDSHLKPLDAYRDYMTVVSQTDVAMASSITADEIGGGHDRASSVFLTQAHPLRKSGSVYLGKSIDQIHADRFGQDTVMPSLELTTELGGPGGCEYSYHCAYQTTIAWKSATEPLPPIHDPRTVFEQLFGAGDSMADRAERLRTNKSLLDWVVSELAGLKKDLGPTDRRALDQYTTQIREMERRLQLIEAQNQTGEERTMPEKPSGVPDRWEDHMQLMFDLQLLALQADLTRVITFKPGADRSNMSFPESGTSKPWHSASHHGNTPAGIMDFNKINQYRLSQFTYFLDKLKNTMEGDASLLDKTVIVWGSAMGDGNTHNNIRCPLLLLGHGNGALEGNLHLRAPKGTPMANVFVSLMQRIGHDDMRSFGDSTSEFELTYPRGPVADAQGVL